MKLSHLDEKGAARMVDVSGKKITRRTARASGRIRLAPATLELIAKGTGKKGDVLAAARIAGICAAKKTSDIIPLCHNIALDHVEVALKKCEYGLQILSKVVSTGRTGAEMEALTAVSAAALTIYDMCKAVDRKMRIENIRLVEKKSE